MSKEIDRQLILDYRAGKGEALNDLVKRWHKVFCTKAFYVVKDADESKDVAQDAWRVIINKLSELEDPSKFSSWALRIVHNKAIDILRKRQKEYPVKLRYEIREAELDQPYKDKKELMQLMRETIDALPMEQQMVVKLFYLEEYSLKEIALMQGIKHGTVKSRLFHAREKLKTILKHKYHEN